MVRPRRLHAGSAHRGRLSRPAPSSALADLATAGLLFAGLLAIYIAVSRHTFVAYDAMSMVAVAKNLVNHGTLKTVGAFDDYFRLSTPYSPYGIGMSILIAPAYALSKVVGHQDLLISLVNPVVTAAWAAVVFAIGRTLGWGRRISVIAAAAFGTLTMALQSTTEVFSEPAVGLCIAVMVWMVLRWQRGDRRAPWLVGLAAAAVIQFRADSIFTVWIALLAVPLFVPWRIIMSWRTVVAVAVPVVPSVVFWGWYNHLRYGKYLKTSYNGQGFHTPIGRGLEGFLVSPGKSVFVFNPLALLGVIGLVIMFRINRPLAVMSVLLIVPRLLFFAKWDAWEGGLSWGPRFLLPIVFLLVVGSFALLEAVRSRLPLANLTRAGLIVLGLAGVAVSYLSVRVPYEQWYGTVQTPSLRAPFERGHPLLRHPGATNAVLDALDFTIRASPLVGNVDLIEKHKAKMAPIDWQRHSQHGWIELSAGLVLLLAAVSLPDPATTAKQPGGHHSEQVAGPAAPSGRGPALRDDSVR